MIKNGLEIVAYQYDVNNVEFGVKDVRTGRWIAEGCRTVLEAEQERDAYLASMHAFNAGPFSSAQCGAA